MFVSASGLKHIHQKIFNAGFDAEADYFVYKIPIPLAERTFSSELIDLSIAVDNVLPDVINNNLWDQDIIFGKWELRFKAPFTGNKIKLYHAEPSQ